LFAARVGRRFDAFFAHAVYPAQDVGLPQLRGRAAELVPAAGVHDQQAAVGVFQHVGRMEIEAFGDEKILVLRFEGSCVRCENVPGDLVHVEEGGEEIVFVLLAEAN